MDKDYVPAPRQDFTLGMRTLQRGHRGEDVRALQILLKGRGCNGKMHQPDGIFGPNTQGHGLSEKGISRRSQAVGWHCRPHHLGQSAGGAGMSEAIVVALITGGISLAGVIITNLATASKAEKAQAVAQAVTDTKIDELTREVRQHNGFAEKIPLLQAVVKDLQRRVSHLETYHQQQN